ncbi:MAG TPA: hypothetical protein VF144_11800 [Chitinophagaceae bacterium]
MDDTAIEYMGGDLVVFTVPVLIGFFLWTNIDEYHSGKVQEREWKSY